MDSKRQTARSRVKEFAKNQRLGVSKFSEVCGFSHNILTREQGDISAYSLQLVSKAFPDLNMDWVITGRGSMCLKN